MGIESLYFDRNLRILPFHALSQNRHVMEDGMRKHTRILATIVLMATTFGCLSICPPPQTLVSLRLDGSPCHSSRVIADFRMTSAGLEFEVRRSENLHVCVVLQESH